MRHTRAQVSTALRAFGATREQAEAFTGPPRTRTVKAKSADYLTHAQRCRLIRAELRSYGWPAVIINTQGIPIRKNGKWTGEMRPAPDVGIHDVYSTIPPTGQALWVEVKTEGDTLSEGQQKFAAAQRAAGAICLMVRSVEELQVEVQRAMEAIS